MRYMMRDDSQNKYYVETPLPEMGRAMSIYIREVTTIDEDYHYLFGYALIGLFTDVGPTPGVTREYTVGKIINDHDPAQDREQYRFSSTVYFRQDPFKQTIYIQKYNFLYLLAQLVGALTLLNFLGYLFTSFWTNRLYNASMIKHLYKVKHTSAGRDNKPVPLSKHSPTDENKDNKDPMGKKNKDRQRVGQGIPTIDHTKPAMSSTWPNQRRRWHVSRS